MYDVCTIVICEIVFTNMITTAVSLRMISNWLKYNFSDISKLLLLLSNCLAIKGGNCDALQHVAVQRRASCSGF